MDTDEPAGFETVDWSEVHGSRNRVTAERATAVLGTLLLLGLFLYDRFYTRIYTLGEWTAEPIEWLVLLATVVLLAYGVIPLLRRRNTVTRLLGTLRSNPIALVGTIYLGGFVLVGTLGPVLLSDPSLRFEHAYQAPYGFASEAYANCTGTEIGPPLDSACRGSLTYPLGTNHRGFPMQFLLVSGARTALYIVVATAAFVVPVATAVGVVAGLRGGYVDDLLTSYVDVQLSIPAIVFYFLGYSYWGPSLLLLILAFGLLSWGGIARLVRSEVIQRREKGHVLVARTLGASDRYLAWRHIVPNVTNTLVPAVFQLLALLVLFEAGVAFLGFHELQTYSWGATISESTNAVHPSAMQTRADEPAHVIWWVSALPALALALTMLSFKFVGDWLRDALDPRTQS